MSRPARSVSLPPGGGSELTPSVEPQAPPSSSPTTQRGRKGRGGEPSWPPRAIPEAPHPLLVGGTAAPCPYRREPVRETGVRPTVRVEAGRGGELCSPPLTLSGGAT